MNLPRLLTFLCVALAFGFLPPHSQAQERSNYTPTSPDVRYGPYDRNVLDFFQAKSTKPTPVLIYFHGGGWIGGDKKSFNPTPVLRAGISLVTANYRFTTGTPDAAPFPA